MRTYGKRILNEIPFLNYIKRKNKKLDDNNNINKRNEFKMIKILRENL